MISIFYDDWSATVSSAGKMGLLLNLNNLGFKNFSIVGVSVDLHT